jgi:hypothetical protein
MDERLSPPQTQAFSKDVYLSPPARSLPNFSRPLKVNETSRRRVVATFYVSIFFSFIYAYGL